MSAESTPTWSVASCLVRRVELVGAGLEGFGAFLGDEQLAEEVLEGEEDDAEEGDRGETDAVVEVGDADGHQSGEELGGKDREEAASLHQPRGTRHGRRPSN